MPMPRTAPDVIPHTSFDQYKDKYASHFLLDRTETGVLTAKWHTNGGSLVWDNPIHRAIHQLTTDVGQDVETEVLILGGAGPNWIAQIQPNVEENDENRSWLSYEHMYYDGTNILSLIHI